MFVNENYERYSYLVETSDNYIVLARQSSVSADWQNPETIDVVYQYIKPSTYCFEDTRTFTNSRSFVYVNTSSDFWERADVPEILCCSFMMFFFLLFLLNGLTRIARKGGIFFGS